MYCTKCGQEVSDYAKFCTNCGATIEETVTTEGSVFDRYVKEPEITITDYEVPVSRPGRSLVRIIIAIVLAIAVVGTGVCGFFTVRDPKGTWRLESASVTYNGETKEQEVEGNEGRTVEIKKDTMILYVDGEETSDEEIEIKGNKIINPDNEDQFIKFSWNGLSLVLEQEESGMEMKIVLSRVWTFDFIVKVAVLGAVLVALIIAFFIVLFTKGKQQSYEDMSYEPATYEPLTNETLAYEPLVNETLTYEPPAYEPPVAPAPIAPPVDSTPVVPPVAPAPVVPSVTPAPVAPPTEEPHLISTMRKARPSDGHTAPSSKEEGGGFFKSAGDL